MSARAKDILLNGVFAIGLGIVGCSGNPGSRFLGDVVDYPTLVEKNRDWRLKEIPANNNSVKIEDVENLQSEDVGLKELYVANSGESAKVLILAVFDPNRVNLAQQYITYNLQAYQPNFVAEDFVFKNNPDSTQNGLQAWFLRKAGISLPPAIAENKIPYVWGVTDKPKEPSVLVLKVVNMLVFLKIEFNFEKEGIRLPIIK